MFEKKILVLRTNLLQHANPKTAAWWEDYVKDSAPFMGVKMQTVRTLVRQWYEEQVQGQIELQDQVNLALALFEGEFTEEKLAGTLFLQEVLLPNGALECPRDADRFAALFDSGWIHDWNTCDWFCVKVLGPLIQENGMACADRISQWRTAANLWRARASLVAFVKVAGESAYYPDIADTCRVLIQRQERFAKTAVGWALREISRTDERFVRDVIDENIPYFTSESLKNATKYLGKGTQQHYRDALKSASGGSEGPTSSRKN
jgi:3-methyladenine DNA glycosylase AlkD